MEMLAKAEQENQHLNNNHKKRKKKNQNPEAEFRFALDTCSKNNDLPGALSLYEHAISHNIRLTHYHFNALLHLCSSNPTADLSAVDSGFRIYNHMLSSNITPTEATITAAARLAAAKPDADLAFQLLKQASSDYSICPRLRTYGPALFEYCRHANTADKAYEVEEHMTSVGVSPEEPELAALLKVSALSGREDRVYMYLQKLRETMRCVSELTAEAIEGWFQSKLASEVGKLNLDDVGLVKDALLKNGGGWHGQGWLGRGNWQVSRTNVVLEEGHCRCCGERLVCVDVDMEESDKFAESISSLAMERETLSKFAEFKEWLENHGEFDAVVDGANVGLYQQNFADGGFSLSQLDAVVKELHKRSQGKWPLVILHNKRIRALMDSPSRELLEEWRAQGALYTTPNGSNDDWYWLYAAVRRKCLLVTNDEMRDHIFELLGRNFFLKWKERHQVHFTFLKGNLKFRMPPVYSTVIQESEWGSWHVPLEDDSNDESSRTWLCINRLKSFNSDVVESLDVCEADQGACTIENGNLCQPPDCDKTIALLGKRKERSPSPCKVLPHLS